MKTALLLICLGLAGCNGAQPSAPIPKPSQPNILIVGDYTSEQYTPILQAYMAGIAHVYHAETPGQKLVGNGSSDMELAHLPGWLGARKYAFVHLDAITDIDPCHPYQNPLPDYLANLKAMISLIHQAGAVPIFATATPSDGACHPEAVLEQYNAAAVSLIQSLGVTVDDQWTLIHQTPGYVVANTFWLIQAGYQALATDTQNSFGYIPY